MRKFVVLLLLAAIVASIGGLWLPDLLGTDDLPSNAMGDGQQPADNDRASAATTTGTTSERTTAASQTSPHQAPIDTTVRIRLVRAGTDTPLLNYGVTLIGAMQQDDFTIREHSDQRGIATFRVPVQQRRELIAFITGGDEQQFTLIGGEASEVLFRIEPRLFITGSVIDATGQGIASAELLFLPRQIRQLPELPRLTRVGHTSGDGSFHVTLPMSGSLGANHPLYAPSSMVAVHDPDQTAAAVTVTRQLVLMARPGHAHGIILDVDGRPAARAIVEFRAIDVGSTSPRRNAPPIRLRADADGRFSTADLSPGAARYEAMADRGNCAQGVFTARDFAGEELRIRLQHPATVQGRVDDPEDLAEPRVTVQAGRPGDLLSRRVVCQPDGSYRLTGLPPGPCQLTAHEIEPSSPSVARRHASTTLELAAGKPTDWSPTLPSITAPHLEGLLVDLGAVPLPNWTILGHQIGQPLVRVTTNPQGRFRLPVRGEARFDVHVYAPNRTLTAFATLLVRDVDPAAGRLELKVDRSAQTAVVAGLVQDQQHKQLPARVVCRHQASQQTVVTTAGTDGSFRFDAVPPGNIVLLCSHPGYLQTTRELEVPPIPHVDAGVFTLEFGSAVHGSVTAPQASLPAELLISIQTDEARFRADYAAGNYRFDAIPAGNHRLLIQGTGIAASSHPIDVPHGTELQQDIIVQPGVTRQIRVHLASDDARWITLALQEAGKPYTWLHGQPRGEGTTALFEACMASGTYEAITWDDTGKQARQSVTFGGGHTEPVTIELPAR